MAAVCDRHSRRSRLECARSPNSRIARSGSKTASSRWMMAPAELSIGPSSSACGSMIRRTSDTPMCAALAQAHDLLVNWVEAHPEAYPPTVLNITDGAATDGDPRDAASRVGQIATADGEVLLLNCHISGYGGSPTFYPSAVDGLPDDLAHLLFEMSSLLPERLLQGARAAGYPVTDGARGFGYQADAAALIKFIEIGTRAGDIVVRE